MDSENEEYKFAYLIENRNPLTERKHRRQVFWQITLPLLVGALVLIAACVLPVITVIGGGEVSVWADISLMWLIVIAFIIALIPLALLGGLVFGLTQLIGKLPPVFFRIQGLLRTLNLRVSQLSDRVVNPFIRINSLSAGFRSALEVLSRSKSVPR